MYDYKISPYESTEVTRMITWSESRCGKIRIYRSKVHNCLGLDLEYSMPGYISIRMEICVSNIIEDFT